MRLAYSLKFPARPLLGAGRLASRSLMRRFSVKCPFEAKLELFQKVKLRELEQEYCLFLQDIKQYYHKGNIYDLYDITFIRQILRHSQRKYPLYQMSSIVYYRKLRRFKPYDTDSQYYVDARNYMNDFYTQRSDEISDTLADLCLEYDLAAKVIFERIAKEDAEIHSMLHDNKFFIELLDPKPPSSTANSILVTAMNALKDDFVLLEIDDDTRRGDDVWIVYMANLIKAYDVAFQKSGLDEEDIRGLARAYGKYGYLETLENNIMLKVKERYAPLAVVEDVAE